MKNVNIISGLAVMALLSTPMVALAQSAEVSGRIAERFGNSVVVDTGDRRVLVETSDASGPAFEPGTEVTFTGDLDGDTMRAAQLRPNDDTSARPAPDTGSENSNAAVTGPLTMLDLQDVREDRKSDGELEIRAMLAGDLRIEAEYDRDGRLEEVKTEPRGELPRDFVDAILPQAAREQLQRLNFDRIHEIEFDDDGEIEVKGHINNMPAEAEMTAAGQLIEFERKTDERAEKRPFDMPRPEIEQHVRDAGYDDVERIEIRGRHADVWAENPEGESVRVRVEMNGDITREERR